MKKLNITKMTELNGGGGALCFLAGIQAATVLNPLTWPYSLIAADYGIKCWNS